jgi:hypothetical protein
MDVQRNIEARSRNNCCREKATSIQCSKCVSVALVIYHAKAHAPYYIVNCGLSGSTYFSTLSHRRHDFRKRLLNMTCVLIFSATVVRNISHSKKNFA